MQTCSDRSSSTSIVCSTFDYKKHDVDTFITKFTDFRDSSFLKKLQRYLFVLNNMFV
jgi:hypothetical protein